MERRLYKAAIKGSVPTLLQLLQEDELVLDRYLVGPYTETPLHIAAMLGHYEFSNEILLLKPELACELDSQRSTPLHLAAAKGSVDIVKSLLSACPKACLAVDKYGRNPLQVAAIKGKVEVLEILVLFNAEAARSVNGNGETVLHMCVKNNKLESLKVLVAMFGGNYEFIDWRDKDGNSALHLAAADEQFETVHFLRTKTRADMSSPNQKGFTAQDLLARSKIGAKENSNAYSAHLIEAVAALESGDMLTQTRDSRAHYGARNSFLGGYDCKKHFERQNNWVERMRQALMVVATLTATITFQAGVNPPAGVWQDDLRDNSGDSSAPTPLADSWVTPNRHNAGISIMADKDYDGYITFLVFNTIGFIASLSIILLLISGLPMRRKCCVWVLMVIMWIVITSMAITYLVSIVILAPSDQIDQYVIFRVALFAWMGLMALLIIVHSIRIIKRALRACWRAVTSRNTSIMV